MRFLVAVFLLFGSFYGIHSQNTTKPKLVVGIVVDQMRFDYLTRFGDRFCEEGFNGSKPSIVQGVFENF